MWIHAQWLRATDGRRTGLAMFFGRPGVILAASNGMNRPWRICDQCKEAQALVFCRSHGQYFCEGCLPAHLRQRQNTCGSMLSMAAVQQLAAETNLKWP